MSSVFEEQRGRLCTVCYHQYTCQGDHVPRILTCGHSFCTGCLRRLLAQLPKGRICCPTCKGNTVLPGLFSNDINKVAKNFGVLEILESLDEGAGVQATSEGSNSNPTVHVPVCGEHDNEPQKVFCIQDDQLICIYCQVYGAHQGHQCQLVSVLADENRKTIQSYVELLKEHKATMVSATRAVNNTCEAVQAKEDKLMYDMTQHFDVLRRKLYQRENQLKVLLSNRTSAKTMVLDKQKKELQGLKSKVDKLSTTSETIMSGPNHELLQLKTKIETDFNTLSESIKHCNKRPGSRDDLKFHLDPGLMVQIGSHGVLANEYRPSTCGDTTTTAQMHTGAVGSGGDADRHDGDCEHIELTEEAESNSNNTRQSSRNSSDVIILNEDMDLEVLEPQNTRRGIIQSVAQPTEPAIRDPTNARPTETPVEDHVTHLGANRSGVARSDVRRNPGMCNVRAQDTPMNDSDSSTDDDLIELDMDLDHRLRSAWSNGGGWSGAAPTSVTTAFDEAIGSVSSMWSSLTREMEAGAFFSLRPGLPDRPGTTTPGAQGDNLQQPGVVDERDVSDVAGSSSTQRHSRQGHQLSQLPRYKAASPTCCIFNCSNSSGLLSCKNCSGVFCPRCVTTSPIGARRCYRRRRGHDFIPIRFTSGAATRSSRPSHHIRSSTRQQDRPSQLGESSPTSLTAREALHPAGTWYCLNCLTVNPLENDAQNCSNCGQSRNGTQYETNVASTSSVHIERIPSTESANPEVIHENLVNIDVHVAEVYTVEDDV